MFTDIFKFQVPVSAELRLAGQRPYTGIWSLGTFTFMYSRMDQGKQGKLCEMRSTLLGMGMNLNAIQLTKN